MRSFVGSPRAFWTAAQPSGSISLYRWLAGQAALLKSLREKPVVRRSDGEHVAAFDGDRPQVWLPPEGETSYPVVDRTVAADAEALEFLRRLGLTEPDAIDEVLTAILPRYHSNTKTRARLSTHRTSIASQQLSTVAQA